MHVLDDTNLAQAADLLGEGFPGLPVGFWPQALARLKRYGGNVQAGVPLGYFMLDKGQPVGVMLTPASVRQRADGSMTRMVNLSSWYVREAFRWRAGFLLRGVLADKSAVYTDLTATPELQTTLSVLGLQAINRGLAIHPLPLLCLHPSRGARLHELLPSEPWPDRGPPRAMVEAHRELGCMPLVLEHGGQQQLVICRRVTLRGLPAAQLVYAESRSALLHHIGVLARYLLAQGFAFLLRDTRQTASSATAIFRAREVWFASGDKFDDHTDIFASELCIIHPPSRWP